MVWLTILPLIEKFKSVLLWIGGVGLGLLGIFIAIERNKNKAVTAAVQNVADQSQQQAAVTTRAEAEAVLNAPSTIGGVEDTLEQGRF